MFVKLTRCTWLLNGEKVGKPVLGQWLHLNAAAGPESSMFSGTTERLALRQDAITLTTK